MRRAVTALVWFAVGLTSTVGSAQGDFNPGGRRARPAVVRPGPRRPAPVRRKRPPRKRPDKPDVDKLIARYTKLLLSKPHEAFPLHKLAQLYRQRDGDLSKLVAAFEKRVAALGARGFKTRLALAGIYLQARRPDDARKLLAKLAKDRPKATSPRLMLARLAEQAGRHAEARDNYRAALSQLRKPIEKERVMRALMILSIQLREWGAARRYHRMLVRAAGGSLFVRRELATELLQRGYFARAEKEFRIVLKASAGDHRAVVPALRDLGKSLAKQKKMVDAMAVFKRARRLAPSGGGLRAEILALMTESYRQQGKLGELVVLLEAEKGRDAQRLATIGMLYEETGQVAKALATYRRVLRIDRKSIDIRVRLVHLLQSAGQLQEAILQYEALIKAAPHEPDFVFELAETHLQRGERAKALKLVSKLERRSAKEADILASVADFYERIEEPKRAIAVFKRLAGLPSADPQHLIDLGDRYFQQGRKKKAEATWARIRKVVPGRARASAMLGEVYLEHDMAARALASFREALRLQPKSQRYRKQLAVALERTASEGSRSGKRFREALAIWQELLQQAGQNRLLARESRTHIVGIWALLKQLRQQEAPLAKRFAAKPPDLEAGRLLAEVQRRRHHLKASEETLRRIVAQRPGDEPSWLALERVLVMRRDHDGAIAVMKKLVLLNPKQARRYYERMAQYAAELYRDDDAVAYAAKAVELSPRDALGHYRLGKMYRHRQDLPRAKAAFRKAIAENERLFRAYFELAEILVSAGEVEEADRMYRHVVRASRDEAELTRAARMSMQLNIGRGKLLELERELLPLALGNPQKKVYGRLLVELYGAVSYPLVHRVRFAPREDASRARAELAKIGARAVKPLLDALADERAGQQRIAILVLAHVQNKAAGPALFNFALGDAPHELRVRAMLACGALGDRSLIGRYREYLTPADGGGAMVGVAVAAAWGVANMGGPKAEKLLVALLRSASSDVRALAAIGLGLARKSKHATILAEMARRSEAGPLTRAAAAFALGEIGSTKHAALLLGLTDARSSRLRSVALLALARLPSSVVAGSPEDDVAAIVARGLLSASVQQRAVAMQAASAHVSGRYERPRGGLPLADGVLVVADVLEGLGPRPYSVEAQVAALAQLKRALVAEALAATATSPTRAKVVAELLVGGLQGLVARGAGERLSPGQVQRLALTAESMARATVPGFVALARHPAVEVRRRSIELLATRSEAMASEAVVAALDEVDPEICRSALASLGGKVDGPTADAVLKLLGRARAWSLRASAAAALARVAVERGGVRRRIEAALARAAVDDDFALVREAAVRAVATQSPPFAAAVLKRVANSEREPRVRKVAAALARQIAASKSR